MDSYRKALECDKDKFEHYYKKSLFKTEQQLFLEKLLENDNNFYNAKNIADIAAGGGTLSYHLNNLNSNCTYTLVDYNENALEIAKEINPSSNFIIKKDNIFNLDLDSNNFDMTFCWMTLLLFDEPEKALDELIRITKKGGKIYLSSLFNTEYDVDIYTKFLDHTRESSKEKHFINYNTFSNTTINKWLTNKVKKYKIHPFEPNIDIEYKGRGIGTNTFKSGDKRLQISGGMLMNWGILEIEV